MNDSTKKQHNANGLQWTSSYKSFCGVYSFSYLNLFGIKNRLFTIALFIVFNLLPTDVWALVTVANNVTTDISGDMAGETYVVQSGGTLRLIGSASNVGSVTINAGGKLNVQATFTLAITGNLVLEASAADVSFSILNSGAITVGGTRTYVKTINDANWYFLSFPCEIDVDTQISSAGALGTNWFIKKYDGAKRANYDGTTNWISVAPSAGNKLYKNQGYIFGSASGDRTITFTLSTDVLTEENTVGVLENSGTAGISHHGWNLVGQPYLSNFDGTDVNITQLYLNIWNGTTYTQVARANALLKPFSAYFVQVDATGDITFNGTGDGRYLASANNSNIEVESASITVTSTTGSDYTTLNIDPTETANYRINHDLEKMITTGTGTPQTYTVLGGFNYAFNALPIENVQNLPLSVYTKDAGSVTISANMTSAPSILHLLLTDNTTAITTDLVSSTYTYTALAGTESSRFTLTAQNVATTNKTLSASNKPTMTVAGNRLVVTNISGKCSIQVVDAQGRLVASKKTDNKSVEIPLPAKGIYIVQLQTDTNSWTEKIANR